MTSPLRTSFAALAVSLFLLVGTAACGSSSGTTAAAGTQVADGTMSVRSATIDWPANPSVAAVRMVVHNGTDTADSLIGVGSPIAASTSIHRSQTDSQGRSTMAPVTKLALPARSSVTFEPNGLHVMLTGITKDIQVGDTVPLTLTFEHARPITVSAKVIKPGTAPEGSHDH